MATDTRAIASDLLASLDRDIAVAHAACDWTERDDLRRLRAYAYAIDRSFAAIAGAREIQQHTDEDGAYVLHMPARLRMG